MIIVFKQFRDKVYNYVMKTMPGVVKLQQKKNKFFDIFFRIMTHLAGVGVYAAIIPTAWWIHPTKEAIELSNDLLLLICITTYLGNFMKNLFACPRPTGVWQPVKEQDFGLPSTHTMNAFANALFFIVRLHLSLPLSIVLLLYASIVALSRIYMGVHSPADVIAGTVLGCLSVFVFVVFPPLPLIFLMHLILLSLHPLCFSKYTPCYWRSVLGFGYILLNFSMEVFHKHKYLGDVPSYLCLLKTPVQTVVVFMTGLLISVSSSISLKILFVLFSKTKRFMNGVNKVFNTIRFQCLGDQQEFTDEMALNKGIYMVETVSTYIGAIIIAWCCKSFSPQILQFLFPKFFQSNSC